MVFLAVLLLVPSVSFAQVPAGLPEYSCVLNVLVGKTCTKNNAGDTTKEIPASVTICTADETSSSKYTCETKFEGGMVQNCTSTNGKLSCKTTAPNGETSKTDETPRIQKAASAVVNASAGLFEIVAEPLLKAISLFILTFAGWILGVVGVFFNWMVIRTVFQFGTYFGTSESMLIAWGVIRDIANIGLLFGFIFMGVLLILNVEGGGHGHGGGISARKAIPRLIIFAVLLNFSLFASQAVVDVSNAFSAQFAGLAGMQCDSSNKELSTDECANEGIAGKVMQMAGIGTIWNNDVNETGVVLLGLAVFVTITAIVLLAAGIMLIIRVVVLTLLMITSPIGFAGMVIPGLGGLAKQWWHMLLSQSFFAPVMLLLMFISLKMAEGLNPNGTSLAAAFTGGNAGNAGNMAVLVVFAIVIGLMLASLMAASKMGAMGAKFATNSASGLVFGAMTKGAGLTVGAGAYAARLGMQRGGTELLGKVGGRVGGLVGFKDVGQKWGEGAGKVLVNRGLDPLSKATLDARRVPGMAALLGAAGIDAGAKPSEHGGFTDMQHQFADFKDGKKGQELEQQYQDQINERRAEKEAHDLDAGGTKPFSEESEKFISTRSAEQLAKLHGVKGGSAALAQAVTPDQFSKLMDDEKLLSPTEREAFRSARFKKLSAAVSAGDDKLIKSLLRGMTESEKERLPSELKRNKKLLANLSDSDRKALSKSSRYTSSERDLVKSSYTHEQIKQIFKAAEFAAVEAAKSAGKTAAVQKAEGRQAAVDAVLASGKLFEVKNDKVPEIDFDILVQPEIAFSLNANMLKQIGRNTENFTPANLIEIGKHINRSDPEVKKFLKNNPGYG